MSFMSASALQSGGAGLLAGGDLAAGQSAAAIGQYDQQVAQVNAQQALAAGQTNAAIIGTQVAQTEGQAQASYGAAGVTMSGSPLAVMASIASQGALQQRLAMWTATQKAQSDLSQGAIANAQGQAAQTADEIKAGGTLLTGAAQLLSTAKAGAGTSPGLFG